MSRFRFASLSGTFTNVAYVPRDVNTFDKLFFCRFKSLRCKGLSLFCGRKFRKISKNFSKFLKFLFFGPTMGLFLALLGFLPLLGLLSPLFHWILRQNFNLGLYIDPLRLQMPIGLPGCLIYGDMGMPRLRFREKSYGMAETMTTHEMPYQELKKILRI